jgi:hypothetical protein
MFRNLIMNYKTYPEYDFRQQVWKGDDLPNVKQVRMEITTAVRMENDGVWYLIPIRIHNSIMLIDGADAGLLFLQAREDLHRKFHAEAYRTHRLYKIAENIQLQKDDYGRTAIEVDPDQHTEEERLKHEYERGSI